MWYIFLTFKNFPVSQQNYFTISMIMKAKRIYRQGIVMETNFVLCQVGTDFSRIVQINLDLQRDNVLRAQCKKSTASNCQSTAIAGPMSLVRMQHNSTL
jgi:hypothetical protein